MKIAFCRLSSRPFVYTLLSDEEGFDDLSSFEGEILEVATLVEEVENVGIVVTSQCFRRGFWPAMSLTDRPNGATRLMATPHITCSSSAEENVNFSEEYIDGLGQPTFNTDTVLPMGEWGSSYFLAIGENRIQLANWTHVTTLATSSPRRRLLRRTEAGNTNTVVMPNRRGVYPPGWAPAQPSRVSPVAPPALVTPARELGKHLHPYHTNVVKEFNLNIPNGELFIGLELEFKLSKEIEVNHLVSWFQNLEAARTALATRDSTVDCELVVAPHRPKDLISWLDDNQDIISKLGYGPGVGAHMHVSKAAFKSRLAQANFVIMVTEDAANNLELFGSPDPKWACLKEKNMTNWESINRREGVNTLNTKTIEVRAFRGTEDVEIIKKRVEYLVQKVDEANTLANKDEQVAVQQSPSGDLLDQLNWEHISRSPNNDVADDINDVDF